MLTMRAAATLLSAAKSSSALAALLQASGIVPEFVPLDAAQLDHLGASALRDARLGARSGCCRALVGAVDAAPALLRDAVQRLARRLAARAPHVLWLVAVVDERGGQCALAVWSASDVGAPRIASFLWQPDALVDSDAETLRALSACTGSDSALHARWLDVLGRESLTRRFFRVLEQHVASIAQSYPRGVGAEDAREVALLYVTRLLFLHFLQSKGWLDGQPAFLADRLDECLVDGGGFHQRILLPLFFGTLNTPARTRAPTARAFGRVPFLNGGLFTPAAVERRLRGHRIADDCFVALFDQLFLRFRFVAREDTATWSEASVDPEMLGRAFESLMAAAQRKSGGVFYTPHALVHRVTEHALDAVLADRTPLQSIRILDPACGSGAFLVHALERIAAIRVLRNGGAVADVRRDVLTGSIFGVDRSPTAVWLCQLRLWLSVVVESGEVDPLRVPPLPNLDRNVRVGDALTGPAFSADQTLLAGGAKLAVLRARYARATGARKESLARQMDREERRRVLAGLDREIEHAVRRRRELLSLERARDLFGQRPPGGAASRRLRRSTRDRLRSLRQERRAIADGGALPLAFGALFGDVQANGGFHAVIGNPPWVRLHNIPTPLRVRLRGSYTVFASAPWQEGTSAANASRGFASQVDLSALFVERGLSLLRDGGVLGFLLPAKLWKSLAGGGVRQLLAGRATLVALEDLGDSPAAFDAVVYPSILAARALPGHRHRARVAVERRGTRHEWEAGVRDIAFDDSAGAPWLLLPAPVRSAFDRFRSAGRPLTSVLGAPRLGVKSGCNSAFVIRVESASHGIASIIDADGERGTIEQEVLRPALRGDALAAWRRLPCDEHVIWTHDERGAPLARLPRRARAWLGRSYSALALRADSRDRGRWWSLFRTDAADASRPRVVWADFGRTPRALVLAAGDVAVPLNTCYVMHCRDERHAHTLCAILNSGPAAAWINAIAEPARGGFRRYLGWTIGLLPLPLDWQRAVAVLGAGSAASLASQDLDALVLEAYGLRRADMLPLLEW